MLHCWSARTWHSLLGQESNVDLVADGGGGDGDDGGGGDIVVIMFVLSFCFRPPRLLVIADINFLSCDLCIMYKTAWWPRYLRKQRNENANDVTLCTGHSPLQEKSKRRILQVIKSNHNLSELHDTSKADVRCTYWKDHTKASSSFCFLFSWYVTCIRNNHSPTCSLPFAYWVWP